MVVILPVLTQFNKHLTLFPQLCVSLSKHEKKPAEAWASSLESTHFWSCCSRWIRTHSDCYTFPTMLGCWVWDVGADSEWSVMSWCCEKGWGKVFFKATEVSDRLGTCCQVKYRLELCEIPQGQKASIFVENSPPVRIPAAETPINAEVLRGNWIAKWLHEDDGIKAPGK